MRPLSLWLVGLLTFSVIGVSCTPPTTSTGTAATTEGDEAQTPTVAYVTNGIASFWDIAEVGAHAAAADHNVNLEVMMPASDGRIANQKRQIEELLTKGVSGMAVSPIDPANQGDLLDSVAEQCNLLTHDSDAPDTKRLAYIGMNNYTAGRLCGQLVAEALPDGGKVMLFIGSLDQDNARLRRQGVIDELMARTEDFSRYDEPKTEPIKGDKYTIVATRIDNFDYGIAKALPEDAITANPDLDAMVGLFAYNPPYMLEAIKGAGKLGEIQLIGFDEDEGTLQAIQDGHCYGTVVQNPYMYGYESVRILAGLARGDKSVIPENGYLEIPARQIRKDIVDKFWSELKERLERGKAASEKKDAAGSSNASE